MLYREIIVVCSEIHTKHINTVITILFLTIRCQTVPCTQLTPCRHRLSFVTFFLSTSDLFCELDENETLSVCLYFLKSFQICHGTQFSHSNSAVNSEEQIIFSVHVSLPTGRVTISVLPQ